VRLFHGTDPESAAALEASASLDHAQARARHTDGQPGFYLASALADAEFFAVRHGSGRVIAYDVSGTALEELLKGGATYGPIPIGPSSPYFTGSQLFIPSALFQMFNELVDKGEISVHSEFA
jgi:hypothetical protein